MKTGFKTHCETTSEQIRQDLGLPYFSTLPARQLAKRIGVPIFTPAQIPELSSQSLEALKNTNDAWSAVTFYVAGDAYVIFNDDHSPARQESDLMHEMAHIICKHPPSRITSLGGITFRDFNTVQEEEAKWMGATLQIPRRGLMWALYRRMTIEAIAAHFGASEQLVRYRQNTTGALAQLVRTKAKF